MQKLGNEDVSYEDFEKELLKKEAFISILNSYLQFYYSVVRNGDYLFL